jgi:hypothetical protein
MKKFEFYSNKIIYGVIIDDDVLHLFHDIIRFMKENKYGDFANSAKLVSIDRFTKNELGNWFFGLVKWDYISKEQEPCYYIGFDADVNEDLATLYDKFKKMINDYVEGNFQEYDDEIGFQLPVPRLSYLSGENPLDTSRGDAMLDGAS